MQPLRHTSGNFPPQDVLVNPHYHHSAHLDLDVDNLDDLPPPPDVMEVVASSGLSPEHLSQTRANVPNLPDNQGSVICIFIVLLNLMFTFFEHIKKLFFIILVTAASRLSTDSDEIYATVDEKVDEASVDEASYRIETDVNDCKQPQPFPLPLPDGIQKPLQTFPLLSPPVKSSEIGFLQKDVFFLQHINTPYSDLSEKVIKTRALKPPKLDWLWPNYSALGASKLPSLPENYSALGASKLPSLPEVDYPAVLEVVPEHDLPDGEAGQVVYPDLGPVYDDPDDPCQDEVEEER